MAHDRPSGCEQGEQDPGPDLLRKRTGERSRLQPRGVLRHGSDRTGAWPSHQFAGGAL